MPDAILLLTLTVPAEARAAALDAMANGTIDEFGEVTVRPAVSFTASEVTELRDSELLLVSARASAAATTDLAERFWRAVEARLFAQGVSAIEHMAAYAVSDS